MGEREKNKIYLIEKNNGYELYVNDELIFDSVENSLDNINDMVSLLEEFGFKVNECP